MKTAIRTIIDLSGTYSHYYIQILSNERYPKVCGYIHWQGNKEDNGQKWYSRTYTVENGKQSDLSYMAKIAGLIEDNCYYDTQPEEIKQIIGAIEYFVSYEFPGFYPVSQKGMKVYKVVRQGEHYATIISPNLLTAEKQLKRDYQNNGILEDIGILS